MKLCYLIEVKNKTFPRNDVSCIDASACAELFSSAISEGILRGRQHT